MPNLSILDTQITLKGNVGLVDILGAAYLFTFGPRWQCIAVSVLQCIAVGHELFQNISKKQ